MKVLIMFIIRSIDSCWENPSRNTEICESDKTASDEVESGSILCIPTLIPSESPKAPFHMDIRVENVRIRER